MSKLVVSLVTVTDSVFRSLCAGMRKSVVSGHMSNNAKVKSKIAVRTVSVLSLSCLRPTVEFIVLAAGRYFPWLL